MPADSLSHLTRPAADNAEGLLVLFHGRGADERDLFPLLDLLDPERRMLGVTPRGPLHLPPGGAHWYAVERIGYPDPATFTATFALAANWLDDLADEAGVPPERTVLGGFSQGAVMTYALGLGAGRPRPAGLIALSGFMPTVPGFDFDLTQPLPALRDRARCARPGDLRRVEPRRASAPRGSGRRRHVPRVSAHGALDRPDIPTCAAGLACRDGSSRRVRLSTGAEMRVTGPVDECAVVCVNGGQAREVEGTWSASIEWLVQTLAPRLPELGFAEVRYRVKSWRRLESCVDDARAAVAEAGAPRVVLLGFSMGGAVSVAIANEPVVEEVVGLAPWIPDQLDVSTLRRKRLAVFHGALDRWLPGVPGVSASHSRKGFDRARERGAEGRYVLIPGALHGIALRSPWGKLIRLPKADRWAELVEEELRRVVSSRSEADDVEPAGLPTAS